MSFVEDLRYSRKAVQGEERRERSGGEAARGSAPRLHHVCVSKAPLTPADWNSQLLLPYRLLDARTSATHVPTVLIPGTFVMTCIRKIVLLPYALF